MPPKGSKIYNEERNYRETEARRTAADVWREMGKPDIGLEKWQLIFPKIFGTIEDLKPTF